MIPWEHQRPQDYYFRRALRILVLKSGEGGKEGAGVREGLREGGSKEEEEEKRREGRRGEGTRERRMQLRWEERGAQDPEPKQG